METGGSKMAGDLTIALPKGRLAQDAVRFLADAGYAVPESLDETRQLILSGGDGFRYILAKPADVPTYVSHGAADVGIVGLDVLRESGADLYEPLPLPFGYCRLVVAGPADRPRRPLRLEIRPRVATKYPNLTEAFFRSRGISADNIFLNGSVELAPLVGLSDLIVDLVQTGNTLRANRLVELETVMESQAVLVVNRASYRLNEVLLEGFIARLREVVSAWEQGLREPGGP